MTIPTAIGALGFSRTIQKAKDKSFTFGLSGFKGEHKESLDGQ